MGLGGKWICCTSYRSRRCWSASRFCRSSSRTCGSIRWHRRRSRAACAVPAIADAALTGGLGEIGRGPRGVRAFIALISALYITAGGIHISGNPRGTPQVNVAFLAIGAVAASLIGTTGGVDVAHSPAARCQPRAQAEDAHRRLLHPHRLEHRRPADTTGRSAALPRVSERRALFFYPGRVFRPGAFCWGTTCCDFLWDRRMRARASAAADVRRRP